MRQIATVQTTDTNAVSEDISVTRLMAAMEAFMAADFDDQIVAQLVQEHAADRDMPLRRAA